MDTIWKIVPILNDYAENHSIFIKYMMRNKTIIIIIIVTKMVKSKNTLVDLKDYSTIFFSLYELRIHEI